MAQRFTTFHNDLQVIAVRIAELHFRFLAALPFKARLT
ncbi:Unknown protein sequence [Pseudomonas coronafaciens pv. oryzae]|nr:Unknown protein sequence [Pseudomonas coronafaciens pv. oryzae]